MLSDALTSPRHAISSSLKVDASPVPTKPPFSRLVSLEQEPPYERPVDRVPFARAMDKR
jgi:hypothetical protein